LAETYGMLAADTSALAAGQATSPSAAEFPAVAALRDPNPLLLAPGREMDLDLLALADRLRASLSALAAYLAGSSPSEQERIRNFLASAASALDLVSAGLLASAG